MVSSPQAAKERSAALRRVAIVLSSLPAPVATRLLHDVDADSKRLLRRTMTSLADVDPMERRLALQNFAGSLKQGEARSRAGGASAGTDEVTLSGASAAGGADSENARGFASSGHPRQPAGQGDAPAPPDSPPSPLAFLSDVDDDQLVSMVGHEHPQTIALVLASIAPSQAARLLPRLEPAQRQEAMSRIGRLNEMPDEALAEIAQHLRRRVEQHASAEKDSSGRRVLDAILAELSAPKHSSNADETPAASSAVATSTGEQHPSRSPDDAPPATGPDAARQVDRLRGVSQLGVAETNGASEEAAAAAQRSGAAQTGAANIGAAGSGAAAGGDAAGDWSTDQIHEHLIGLSPSELCRALGQVDTRDALLALCGVPTEVADAVIRVLPRARAKQVRRGLASLGSLQLREIDQAKEKVAAASLEQTPTAADDRRVGATAVPLAA